MRGPQQRKGAVPVVGGYGGPQLYEIQKELQQWSWKFIAEFDRILGPQLYYDPQTKTWDGFSQNIIPKEGEEYVVNITITYEEGYKGFWPRWNRFKSLKVFL